MVVPASLIHAPSLALPLGVVLSTWALPLDGDSSVRGVQFLVETRKSF
jgi:hypothetical protein